MGVWGAFAPKDKIFMIAKRELDLLILQNTHFLMQTKFSLNTMIQVIDKREFLSKTKKPLEQLQ
ncbi:hypothetical protein HBZS_123080 [Helicobacter bizzozeronii CCUG 35545]|nr:hypothetical protein HBZS_123080 [Helicobacter bizzozeronii CCUG 35545]